MPGAVNILIDSFGTGSTAAVIAALVAGNCFAADSAASKPPRQIVAVAATGLIRPNARTANETERLLFDARDGQLNDFTFRTAMLTASGAQTAAETEKWIGMYEPVRRSILANVPAGTTVDRLKAIHAATHRFILTGMYQETCSDLRKTFANGDFNCLTALAVCLDLCQSAGLNVQPRLIRGHVLLAFETASSEARTFEPGTAEWFVRPMIDVDGSRKLSHVELLGKFYYNRGIEMLCAGNYQEGLALLRTGVALDPSDDDARANLVAGLNNWAVKRCQVGQYREAALLIEQGLALDPGFAPLIANEQLVRAKLAK